VDDDEIVSGVHKFTLDADDEPYRCPDDGTLVSRRICRRNRDYSRRAVSGSVPPSLNSCVRCGFEPAEKRENGAAPSAG
jgi:hypothetical protein